MRRTARSTIETRRPAGCLAAAAVCAALLSLLGCAASDDPNFNPYAPYRGGPTLMQAAEHGVELIDKTLDNLDQRMDNAIN